MQDKNPNATRAKTPRRMSGSRHPAGRGTDDDQSDKTADVCDIEKSRCGRNHIRRSGVIGAVLGKFKIAICLGSRQLGRAGVRAATAGAGCHEADLIGVIISGRFEAKMGKQISALAFISFVFVIFK